MKRTRIVYVAGSLNLGGTERNILHLATHLDPKRFRAEVWSEYEGEALQGELRRLGVPCRSFKSGPSVGRSWPARLVCHNLPFQRKLFRAFRDRPDAIIHAMGFPMTYYAVLLAGLAGCRRIVFAVQDWDVWKTSWRYRALDRLCSCVATKIVADGEGARRLAESAQGMRPDRMVMIYDGVNTEELTPKRSVADVRRELGLAPDRLTVGVIARLDTAKKGQDVFLDALPAANESTPDAQFVLVGDGPDREPLETRAAMLPPAGRPRFAGFRTDLAEVLNAVDVLVIPSRWESVPKILLEAMWLKKCVVATRVGDIEEILDGTCGLLVPPDNPSALADAIGRACADAERRTRLGAAAHRRILDRGLTLDASIEKYEELYEGMA